MRQVDLGYRASGAILGFVAQPENPRDKRDAAIVLWRRIRERIATLPDVATVATSTATPAGGLTAFFQVVREGEDVSKATAANKPSANAVITSGNYFKV